MRETRRHLTLREADLALARGRPVEIFLGPCGKDGVRFAQIDKTANGLAIFVHEMYRTDETFLDLYEAAPLDDNADPAGVVFEATYDDLDALLAQLQTRYPGQNYEMVNFGVLADEYLDYLKRSH